MADWISFQVRDLDSEIVRKLIADADREGRSLSDYMRAILCGHYELDCPPSGSPPKRRMGHVQTMLLRMQPGLHQAIMDDAAKRSLSMQAVVHEILEARYSEVAAS